MLGEPIKNARIAVVIGHNGMNFVSSTDWRLVTEGGIRRILPFSVRPQYPNFLECVAGVSYSGQQGQFTVLPDKENPRSAVVIMGVTGRIAAAVVRGVQSIPGNYAAIKHFACNNQEDNRNYSNSVVSERALREIYLKGFRICVREAAPKAVMSSYNLLNGVYTPNSYDLLTNILRSEWGFDGIVMTDWHSTDSGRADNAAAIRAGNDMIMPGGLKYRWELWKALLGKRLTRRDLEIAASRIIRQIIDSAVAHK